MTDIKVLEIVRTASKGKLRVKIKVDNKIKTMRCGQTVKGSIYISKISLDEKAQTSDTVLTDGSTRQEFSYYNLHTNTAA